MKNIRLGIVGTNFVSDWLANAAKECDGILLAGIYSRDKGRGEAFATRHGVEQAYTDYFAMLRDVDAVYIASPNYAHKDQAIAAMQRGKSVLCEKMMAASYSQALRMRNVAERNDVILLEAMRTDFDPSFAAIEAAVGKIGKIRRAHLEYCQYSSRYDAFKEGTVLNAFNPEICNSALADIGIYPLHMAVMLFGKPESFKASSLFLENGFEGMGSLVLKYPDMLCEVTYSKITDSATPSVIEGEDGSLVIDRVHGAKEVYIIYRDGTRENVTFDYRSDNMVYELAAFRDMMFYRRSGARYLSATLESIRIANEAYRMTGALKHMNVEYMK